MMFRLAFRRYRLPLQVAVRTGHGVWSEREGVIVRLETEDGRRGLGEVAPIPWFGTETADEAESVLRELGADASNERLAAVPVRFGCLRHALASAAADIARLGRAEAVEPSSVTGSETESAAYRAVAALLPAGRAAVARIGPKADAGFRVFKWKVGVADLADELVMLDDVCAALPDGARLRLDANGAWNRRQAERWLERCADRPVEFVEQPCFTAATEGERAVRKTEDVLHGLAADYPTPLALDESLVGEDDVARWIETGWRGVYVVKPSLLGDPVGALARLAQARADVVFSSALETAVGARTALRHAFAWTGNAAAERRGPPRALGFGVWPLFADALYDGPYLTPFLRPADVERIDPEAVWNALS